MRICLIADPSHLARRAAGRVCNRLGFQSMEVSSADGLRKAHRRFNPDLTLVDISLAPNNIGALIVSLRYGLGGGRGTILLTGRDLDASAIDQAMVAGADDYLRRPLDDASLALKLRQFSGAERMAVGQSDGWSPAPRKGPSADAGGVVVQISDWR